MISTDDLFDKLELTKEAINWNRAILGNAGAQESRSPLA